MATSSSSVNELRILKFKDDNRIRESLELHVLYTTLSLACSFHKESHGKLFTANQILSIYDLDSVPDGCKCAIVSVLTNEQGLPISARSINKIRAQRLKFDLTELPYF